MNSTSSLPYVWCRTTARVALLFSLFILIGAAFHRPGAMAQVDGAPPDMPQLTAKQIAARDFLCKIRDELKGKKEEQKVTLTRTCSEWYLSFPHYPAPCCRDVEKDARARADLFGHIGEALAQKCFDEIVDGNISDRCQRLINDSLKQNQK